MEVRRSWLRDVTMEKLGLVVLFSLLSLNSLAWGFEIKNLDIRLPLNLKPTKYKVQLVPFLIPDNFTTRGYVEIAMKCEKETENITMHAVDMTIDYDSVTVEEEEGLQTVGVRSHEVDSDRDFYIAHMDMPLKEGRTYIIKINFTSRLRNGLKGFYRSYYLSDTGEKKYLAVTQFESIYARRAFPCFDEPEMKAKFEVSLGRTKDMIALSNMPIKVGQMGAPM